MELIILTDTGCEDACAEEIMRLIGKKPERSRNALMLEASLEEACVLSYKSCTARRVLARILPDVKDIEALDAPMIPEGLLPEGCTFKAEGEVLMEGITAQELIEEVGGWFHEATGRKVSLSKPDVVIVASMTPGRTLVGIDISGPLAKREWRIMLSNRSLKGTVAASAAIYAGLKAGERILDLLGDDGTLAIEAALILSRTSPRKHAKRLPFERLVDGAWKAAQDAEASEILPITAFCDSLREMKAVRMNSKLAGIERSMRSTRVQIDWADLKLEEGSIDRILTHPPQSGKAMPERVALQRIDDLFNQAAYLLTKKGTITCITGKPEELQAAKKYGLKAKETRHVLMGKLPLTIITYGR